MSTGSVEVAQDQTAAKPEFLSPDMLFDYARQLAVEMSGSTLKQVETDIFGQLQQAIIDVDSTYRSLRTSVANAPLVTGDAEWLIDNFYVFEEQVQEIREDLPPKYFAELPKLQNGEPRVYRLACDFISRRDGLIEEAVLIGYIKAFQDVLPLKIGELWAVPIMLRIGLIQSLAQRSIAIRHDRAKQTEVADILSRWAGGTTLPSELSTCGDTELLVHALHLVDSSNADEAPRLHGLEQLLIEQCPHLHDLVREHHQRQAASQLSIANLITAMRFISALNWVNFFEECSLVEQILTRDPAAIYANMDDESRDRYRHAIEELAKTSNASELEIAELAVAKAAGVRGESPIVARQAHVGYWLIDSGRRELENFSGFRLTWRQAVERTFRTAGLSGYLASIMAVTFGLTALVIQCTFGWTPWNPNFLAILLLIAFSEIGVGIVNYVVTLVVPPRVLAKLALREGIPLNLRSVVVIPSMLSSQKEIHSLLDRLEQHYLTNSDSSLRFALLTDFADSTLQYDPKDDELISTVVAGIRDLNQKYSRSESGPFYLLHRHRTWNAAEGCWMGWERKRGKLMELNQLLLGSVTTNISLIEGDLSRLVSESGHPVRYVITCDSDTQLPFGTVRRLVGAMAHPLNRPCFSEDGLSVVAGYSLIQPRVSVSLVEGNRTWYSRIMANSRGIDPYGTAASDVYQDLFGEGSFTGKGIYDLSAFEHLLAGAFPENQILSHDLVEGCHVRTALASDIEVIDGFPAKYEADARRQHRWVRGDWQILPWLKRRVPVENGLRPNRLSPLARWKIFDNLRRSLAAPAILGSLIFGWYQFPESAWIWSFCGLAAVGNSWIITAILGIVNLSKSKTIALDMQSLLQDIKISTFQTFIQVCSLPHRAVSMIDAITRTTWRMLFSHRNMLEWQTSAATELSLTQVRQNLTYRLWYLPVLSVVVGGTLPYSAATAASPWLLSWLVGPYFLDWISRRRETSQPKLSQINRQWLCQISRSNWNYFEDNLNDHNHWLPPDNVQEHPKYKVANRLSPTNEGLFLVSVVAAYDFGYITLLNATSWWERNLESLMELPRPGGHLLNWYDTATLEPLRPQYISTVDSGNFLACLYVLHESLTEALDSQLFSEIKMEGLRDTLNAGEHAVNSIRAMLPPAELKTLTTFDESVSRLREILSASPKTLRDWTSVIQQFSACHARMSAHQNDNPSEVPAESSPAIVLGREFSRLTDWLNAVVLEYNTFFGWNSLLASLATSPPDDQCWHRQPECRKLLEEIESSTENIASLNAIIRAETAITERLDQLAASVEQSLGHDDVATQLGRESKLQWIDAFRSAFTNSVEQIHRLQERLSAIGVTVTSLIDDMKFNFLFDSTRRLFSIGFNLEEGRLDGSYYDMLCSEARLSSFIAIAKHDAPARHWFRLGRQSTVIAGQHGLLSWGGTMFEYLMPLIFQPRFPNSLLAIACETAVRQQQQFARQRGVPWGVSESAFASISPNSDYQYQSFGVPGLGMKRGLRNDNVVAPYATMLALEISPGDAIQNLRQLERLGMVGRWGFYEALDFTKSRLPAGRTYEHVRCFMAHHQGMSFLSLANFLNEEAIRKRFRRHPLMRTTELLLQEGVPTSSVVLQPHSDETAEVNVPRPVDQPVVSRRLTTYDTATPRCHFLSNGTYAVMLTNSGAGYSRFRDLQISRWRADVTKDDWGQWIYIANPKDDRYWSATYQPTLAIPDSYEVVYSIDKAEYLRSDGDIDSHLEIVVSPEDPVEIRHISLQNNGSESVILELTSYLEVCLATPAADLAHPAFQKLFIETEFIPDSMALLARRRPRSVKESPIWAVHVMCPVEVSSLKWSYETSRAKFLGRGGIAQRPAACVVGNSLSQSTGPVLDPILSFRCQVSIDEGTKCSISFVTGYATSREEALRLANLYHDWRGGQRAFDLAWAYNQMELRHWRATAAQTHRFQRLASAVLFPTLESRGNSESIRSSRLNQSQLWPFGISGDRPIVLVRVDHARQLPFVREMLIAQDFWAFQQLHVDLVLLNALPGSYLDELQEILERLIRETPHRADVRPGTAFVLRSTQLTLQHVQLLESAAAVALDANKGWSNSAFQAVAPVASSASSLTTRSSSDDSTAVKKPFDDRGMIMDYERERFQGITNTEIGMFHESPLEFSNGYGGFAKRGSEYVITHLPEKTPPMPWSNVLANEHFGCLLTDLGGGFTWANNSRENKLTTWSNDPVRDPASEQLFIEDLQSDQLWPIFARPLDTEVQFRVTHRCGSSTFEWRGGGLELRATIFVSTVEPVKFVSIQLKNLHSVERSLAISYFTEWVLGVSREQSAHHIVTDVTPKQNVVFARNGYHPEYPEQVAFLVGIGSNASALGDRTEFFGRNGDSRKPQALTGRSLSGRVGAGLDPCGVIRLEFDVASLQSTTLAYAIGCGSNFTHASNLLEKYSDIAKINLALQENERYWNATLGSIQISTPNRALDILTNQWSLYQTLACRMWGRSGFYQAGGAYGFRDQLQDCMAVVYSKPNLTREHLLRAAARQFVEGDVQHWWHPPTGRGTRTRFSDDLLWLIFATCHYEQVTLDASVWQEDIPYLESPLLDATEQERYECPQVSTHSDSLYQHCCRALQKAFQLGSHGIPLMGCGDWNDGMNSVGEEGKGESVWMGWFLMVIIEKIIPVMREQGDQDLADRYEQHRAKLLSSLELHAWDGEWYRRAYFDDGTPLGSKANRECQLDSLSQSWAVLAGADPERAIQGIEAVLLELVRPNDHLVALLTPPFENSTPSPGYIMGYLKGVRENGGQYTHAVLWLIQALTELGDGIRAMEIFDLINPIHQTLTPADVMRYQVEPYVMAADVYSQHPHVGRGGWTWYTGSSSWTYRIALESILGMKRQGDRVSFDPRVPTDWEQFEVRIRFGQSDWTFLVCIHNDDPESNRASQWTSETEMIQLTDDGQSHFVELRSRRQPINSGLRTRLNDSVLCQQSENSVVSPHGKA